MFGRKGRVRITNDSVYVEGDVVVDDDRTTTRHHTSSKVRFDDKYFPTADEAKKIVPVIREHYIEEVMENTLKKVVEEAKRGRSSALINFWGSNGIKLNVVEKKHVREKLESLGYEVFGGELVVWED